MDWSRFFSLLVSLSLLWPSVISMGFCLFRLKLKPYLSQIIISSILLVFLSMLLQLKNFDSLTAIVQPFCLILCFYIICRFKFIFSLTIVVVVYAFEALVEIYINFVVTSFDIDDLMDKMQNTDLYFSTYFIICMNLILIYLLSKFRLG
jgi:hypothetical protein